MNYSIKPQNKDARDLLISRQAVLSSFIKFVGPQGSLINGSIVGEHHSLLI